MHSPLRTFQQLVTKSDLLLEFDQVCRNVIFMLNNGETIHDRQGPSPIKRPNPTTSSPSEAGTVLAEVYPSGFPRRAGRNDSTPSVRLPRSLWDKTPGTLQQKRGQPFPPLFRPRIPIVKPSTGGG